MKKQSSDPYRPPSAIDSRHQKRSLIYIVACLLWCGLAIGMIILRPMFLKLYEEFELQLPVLTIWLLNPAPNVFVAIIAGGVLLAGPFVKNRDGRRRIGLRALILALAVIAVLLVGFGLPVLQLLQALS